MGERESYMVATFAQDLYRGRGIRAPEAARKSPKGMSCSGSAAVHRRSIEATFAQTLHASIGPSQEIYIKYYVV